MGATDNTSTPRWVGRPWAARLVRALVYGVPFAASVAIAFMLGRVLPAAHGVPMVVGRFIGISLVATLVLIVVDRLTRRMLPLAALLDLTLLFPDQAPSRFKVAIRSASATTLQKRLEEYYSSGADEPARAAERLLELVGALRDHDRLTRGHSERVRAYSQMIGEEMGLSAHDIDRLRWAGLVHDIGKLRIDPAILNKPGKLTDEEFEQIKLHPEYGARLAAPLAAWLGDSVLAVLQHHERWDGGGYPSGLAGNEISQAARIVSVADTFDVMTSVRSYKPARSAVEARQELARCAGSQFDPTVVRAFLSLSLGRLRVAMGPVSWLAQLAKVPQPALINAAAPAANAVAAFTGMAAATLGAVASADAPHDATPARRTEAAVTMTTAMPPEAGAPVEVASGAAAGADDAAITTSPSPERRDEADAPVAATTTTTTVHPGATTTTSVAGRGGQPTTTRAPTASTSAPSNGPSSPAPTTAPRSTTTVPAATIPAATTPVTTTTVAPATTEAVTTTVPATTTTTTAPPAAPLIGTWLLGSSAAGDVMSQEVLPLAMRSPLNTGALPNYDTDRDSAAGLLITKGGTLTLGDPTRLQRFRLTFPVNGDVRGNASVRLYVAPEGLLVNPMSIRVALIKCTGSSLNSCFELASASQNFTGLLSLYQAVDVDLGAINQGFASSNTLEVWVVADASSSKDLLLAYDTTTYPSSLTLS